LANGANKRLKEQRKKLKSRDIFLNIMGYIKYRGKAYDTENEKGINIDYYITIEGLNKEQTCVLFNLVKEKFNLDRKNHSLIQLVNLILEELGSALVNEKSLEGIVQRQERKNPGYYRNRFDNGRGDLEEVLGTSVKEMEVDYLGGGNGWRILGIYDSSTDTVYVLRNLPSDVKRWVYAHERAHRRRHYSGESQNETLVDMEATANVGYNPFPSRHYGVAA